MKLLLNNFVKWRCVLLLILHTHAHTCMHTHTHTNQPYKSHTPHLNDRTSIFTCLHEETENHTNSHKVMLKKKDEILIKRRILNYPKESSKRPLHTKLIFPHVPDVDIHTCRHLPLSVTCRRSQGLWEESEPRGPNGKPNRVKYLQLPYFCPSFYLRPLPTFIHLHRSVLPSLPLPPLRVPFLLLIFSISFHLSHPAAPTNLPFILHTLFYAWLLFFLYLSFPFFNSFSISIRIHSYSLCLISMDHST